MILVVEDDPELRYVMASIFRDEGYLVATAEDGQSALFRMLERRPCVVLLDLSLPILSGFDVLKRMRAAPDLHSIPVVVVSASTERLEKLDVTKVLRKPINLDTLFGIVKACCGAPPLPMPRAPTTPTRS